MFEKHFLAYVLYITLLEIREQSLISGDSRIYHLTDMLHSIPFSLLNEESCKKEFKTMLEAVNALGITDWLSHRTKEFDERFPNFRQEII